MPATINNPGPIWVCDPTGNNNPYLVIKASSIFAAAFNQAVDGMGNQTEPGAFYWSNDGKNWNTGTNGASSLLEFSFLSWGYTNGMWAVQGSYTYNIDNFGDHLQQQIGLTSLDGKTWTLQVSPPGGTTGPVGFSYNFTTNGYTFSWVQGGNPMTFFVANTNPLSSGSPTLFGDFITAPKMDPAQPAAADFPGSILNNSLPSPLTAIRYNQGASPDSFEWSSTSITDAIVNSGPTWPSAAWNQSFIFDQSNPKNSVGYFAVG